VNHGPESVALCSPREATGLFELDVQPEMRLPFEGIGVDTIWRLELPKAANAFDYRTIADVLLTIEYTALDSPEYREQVIRTLDTSVGADRGFSLRDQFPDQWYDLHNPDQTTTPMAVRLRMRREDFPPNLEDLAIEQVVVYLARPTAEPLARPLPIQLHLTRMTESGAQLRAGGTATSTDGLYSTRREAADWRDDLVGSTPFGEWELSLPNDSETRALFIEEQVQDILLVLTYTARTPEWPA
jgi:Tc toxin complex TcA C-terminal TcB-binding domain